MNLSRKIVKKFYLEHTFPLPGNHPQKVISQKNITDNRKLRRQIFNIIPTRSYPQRIPFRVLPHPIRLFPLPNRPWLRLSTTATPPSSIPNLPNTDPTYLRPASFPLLGPFFGTCQIHTHPTGGYVSI